MATGAETSPRFLEIVRNTLVTYKGTAGDGLTLADVSKIARIEPITLISSSLAGQKELYNILHGVLNIYASYYLQAIHILSAQLADVRIMKILDKTNPDRDIKTLLASGYIGLEDKKVLPHELRSNMKTLSLTGSKYRLPMLKDSIATEDIWTEDQDAVLTTSIKRLESFEKLGSAVGKVVEVTFKTQDAYQKASEGTAEVTIPVVIKLDNMVIPNEVINNLMVSSKDQITLGSRFRDAISGRIGFIKDFLLCSDLIKTQKRTMMKDPTGAYAALLKRLNNSKVYSALSGNISLAGISSIAVISEQDEQLIQRAIGGKLTNKMTRDIVFNNTSAMMIVVIDQEWERVSIYIRDMSTYSQNSFSSFKNSTDANNDVMNDMMRSMIAGQAPQF